jgi:N-dimethylarginine dimethylaminohydrolase
MSPKINRTVLISGVDYFSDAFAINALMDSSVVIDLEKAAEEHLEIRSAFEKAGIKVAKTDPPSDCQDGVYTANWGVCRGDVCILSSLPNKRKGEELYAEAVLKKLGKKTIRAPLHFSGQGDCLPCNNLLFCGSGYRTDPKVHKFLEAQLGYKVIGLHTIPKLSADGQPVINSVTGWPDSFFYDLDLALAVITPNLIAWCPEAFDATSQAKIDDLSLDKIIVSYEEALSGFGCNLVSTGETVIMSAQAPELKSELENRGFKTITPEGAELSKGGGYIRCISLTLDNE